MRVAARFMHTQNLKAPTPLPDVLLNLRINKLNNILQQKKQLQQQKN
jgi:hypothetical protein